MYPKSNYSPYYEQRELQVEEGGNYFFEFDLRGAVKSFSREYVEQTFIDVIKNKYYEYFQ